MCNVQIHHRILAVTESFGLERAGVAQLTVGRVPRPDAFLTSNGRRTFFPGYDKKLKGWLPLPRKYRLLKWLDSKLPGDMDARIKTLLKSPDQQKYRFIVAMLNGQSPTNLRRDYAAALGHFGKVLTAEQLDDLVVLLSELLDDDKPAASEIKIQAVFSLMRLYVDTESEALKQLLGALMASTRSGNLVQTLARFFEVYKVMTADDIAMLELLMAGRKDRFVFSGVAVASGQTGAYDPETFIHAELPGLYRKVQFNQSYTVENPDNAKKIVVDVAAQWLKQVRQIHQSSPELFETRQSALAVALYVMALAIYQELAGTWGVTSAVIEDPIKRNKLMDPVFRIWCGNAQRLLKTLQVLTNEDLDAVNSVWEACRVAYPQAPFGLFLRSATLKFLEEHPEAYANDFYIQAVVSFVSPKVKQQFGLQGYWNAITPHYLEVATNNAGVEGVTAGVETPK